MGHSKKTTPTGNETGKPSVFTKCPFLEEGKAQDDDIKNKNTFLLILRTASSFCFPLKKKQRKKKTHTKKSHLS